MSTFHIVHRIERAPQNVIRRIRDFGTATVHEASGGGGALPSGIKPISEGMGLCGPAVTVKTRPGDNLIIHKAIYVARAGDVLVVDSGEYVEAGPWGGIMTTAAKQRKIEGLVINGSVRDSAEIIQMDFPVFSKGLSIKGTSKALGGLINHPISIGNVVINPGDIVLGDRDGVVVIPRQDAEEICKRCQRRSEKERDITEKLKAGHSTLELYGFNEIIKDVGLTEEPEGRRNGRSLG